MAHGIATNDHHLSRTMTPALDPTSGAKAEPLRRLWPAAIAGTLVLAFFNAQGFEKWAARLPDSPVSNSVIVGAQEWKTWMEKLGPARLFEDMRRAFRDFRGA
ncbi:MAG: hypothetical protein ACREIP_04675 [Alphaproteobacteria bacterium]